MPKFTAYDPASRKNFPRWLAWSLMACGLIGCGGTDGPTRIALSGKVTQADQPVRQGSISLVPAAGHRGVAANTAIKDGHYQFTREDGPGPGAYQVTIFVSFTKDELMQRRQTQPAPQTQWDFLINVPNSGSPSEDFRLEAK